MNKKKAQNRFVFACLAPAVILVVILWSFQRLMYLRRHSLKRAIS